MGIGARGSTFRVVAGAFAVWLAVSFTADAAKKKDPGETYPPETLIDLEPGGAYQFQGDGEVYILSRGGDTTIESDGKLSLRSPAPDDPFALALYNEVVAPEKLLAKLPDSVTVGVRARDGVLTDKTLGATETPFGSKTAIVAPRDQILVAKGNGTIAMNSDSSHSAITSKGALRVTQLTTERKLPRSKKSINAYAGSMEFGTNVRDESSQLGVVKISQNSLRYKPSRFYKRVSIPFIYKKEEGDAGSKKTLPWFWTLSAGGERIQLVRDLNQQVLDTDEVFLEAIGTANENLKEFLGFYERYTAGRGGRTDSFGKLQALIQSDPFAGMPDDVKIETLDALKNAAQRDTAVDSSNTSVMQLQEFMESNEFTKLNPEGKIEALSTFKNSVQEDTKIQESLDVVLRPVIENNIGRVSQRFTVFNMRPASVVASERNPVAYSVTDRKFLDSLDLQQAAMVAGAVIQPAVIALGVIDSIAKRVVKKDGDTELHYFSIPVPYDFSGEVGTGDDPAETSVGDGDTSKDPKSKRITNRVQIVSSNNGRYEYHINAEGIKSAADGQIDYVAVNKPTDVLAQAIASDNAVYQAAIEANRDARVAESLANAAKGSIIEEVIEAPKLSSVKDDEKFTITAKPPDGLSPNHEINWNIEVPGDATKKLHYTADGKPETEITVSVKEMKDLGVAKATVKARVIVANLVGAEGSVEISLELIPAPVKVEGKLSEDKKSVVFAATPPDPAPASYAFGWEFESTPADAAIGTGEISSDTKTATFDIATLQKLSVTKLKAKTTIKVGDKKGPVKESGEVDIPKQILELKSLVGEVTGVEYKDKIITFTATAPEGLTEPFEFYWMIENDPPTGDGSLPTSTATTDVLSQTLVFNVATLNAKGIKTISAEAGIQKGGEFGPSKSSGLIKVEEPPVP